MFFVELLGPSISGLVASLFAHVFFDSVLERLNVTTMSRIGRGTAAGCDCYLLPFSPPSDSLPSLAPAGSEFK